MSTPSSGFTTSTPSDILLDSGVLFKGTTPLGVSRGGLRFNPGNELRDTEYDGRKAPVVGLDRVTFRRPTISGRMLEAGATKLLTFEPGGATPGITPIPQGQLLVAGDYHQNIRVVYKRGNGGLCTITFPYALCTRYEIAGQDRGEAEIDVAFEARSLQGATPDESVVPYTIELTGDTP